MPLDARSMFRTLLTLRSPESTLRAVRTVAVTLLLLAGFAMTGCESLGPREPISEFESLQDASDAYLAYERGDCESVLQMTQIPTLEFWEDNELRHSMYLVRGFCMEILDDKRGARRAYEILLASAPTSFAALDARERMRMLRLEEVDPNHAAVIEEARKRALGEVAERVPVKRTIANFPPVPHAAGIEGYALVEFGVTPRGNTSDPLVIESSPPFIFDGAALRAVRMWEYTRKPSASQSDRQVIRLTFVNEHPDETGTREPEEPAPN